MYLNQAETLCSEAEKELSLADESIPEGEKQNIQKLVDEIKQNLQDDKVESLNSLLEDLKESMRKLIEAKSKNQIPS